MGRKPDPQLRSVPCAAFSMDGPGPGRHTYARYFIPHLQKEEPNVVRSPKVNVRNAWILGCGRECDERRLGALSTCRWRAACSGDRFGVAHLHGTV